MKSKNILITGRERSGTKFVNNLIAENLNLATIQSDGHGGVIETNLLQAYPRCFGKVPTEENKKAALYLLSHEYFYFFSSLNSDQLFGFKFKTFPQLFSCFLRLHSNLNNQLGWVYKADSRYLYDYQILNVKLIVVQRKILNQVWSFVKNKGADLRYLNMVKYIFSAHLHRIYESYWILKLGGRCYSYENIATSPKIFLQEISEWLNVPMIELTKLPRFNNSSFDTKDERSKIPNKIIIWNYIALILTFWLPSIFVAYLLKIKYRMSDKVSFVQNSFID